MSKVSIQPKNENGGIVTKFEKFKNNCVSFYNENKALVLSIIVFVISAFLCITILKTLHQGN